VGWKTNWSSVSLWLSERQSALRRYSSAIGRERVRAKIALERQEATAAPESNVARHQPERQSGGRLCAAFYSPERGRVFGKEGEHCAPTFASKQRHQKSTRSVIELSTHFPPFFGLWFRSRFVSAACGRFDALYQSTFASTLQRGAKKYAIPHWFKMIRLR
jgi:hypothetical protein